ncbi:MAG: hypothetical protein M9962_10795 [Oligoflexia bacterium]|nr:hypothetical protein [Oligoflexia bacterium]
MAENIIHELMTPIGKAKTRVKLLMIASEDSDLKNDLQKILKDLEQLEEIIGKKL